MLRLYLFILTITLLASSAPAQTIWDGPDVVFSKAGFADPTLEANQDRLTPGVWITRGNVQGVYNAAVESFQGATSPQGTMWAIGTTADLGSLTFDTWLNTVGLGTTINGPANLNQNPVDFVVHLTAEDIYLDLRFTGWGQGNPAGGSFAYVRSSPGVPEPASLLVVLMGVAALAPLRRRM